MKNYIYFIGIIACIWCTHTACNDRPQQRTLTTAQNQAHSQEIFVDTLTLKRQSFHKQMVCNGKLHAAVKSDLAFRTSGQTIRRIYVRNGDRIKQGATLGILDTKEAQRELQKSRRDMEKARIELTDKLIGLGYSADTTAVPKTILQNAKNASGFDNALDQLQICEQKWADCYLKAPFSGRVANLEAKVYDRSKDFFLTLIDDSQFDVEFSVLEAEINEVVPGLRVKVTPFIQEKEVFTGEITEVNPLIDDKGQIKVRARIRNRNGILVEGMNVKIILEREVKNQFVVPKEAVILRDGFRVIFLYDQGVASWKYVDVVLSNIDSHIITGSTAKQTVLKENDIVIVSNNLSLADGTRVSVNPSQSKVKP